MRPSRFFLSGLHQPRRGGHLKNKLPACVNHETWITVGGMAQAINGGPKIQISTSISPAHARRLAEIVDLETIQRRKKTGNPRARVREAEVTRKAVEAFLASYNETAPTGFEPVAYGLGNRSPADPRDPEGNPG